jgi:hypothetical protein
MAAVAGALSHIKPAAARCPYFFCSSTYLKAGLTPAKNMFNTVFIFKYWPFIVQYCLLVLAKNVECLKCSLLLIPRIMASGYIIKTKTLHALTAIQGNIRKCHELCGEFCHTSICCFGCLHPYLMQTVHNPQKTQLFLFYSCTVLNHAVAQLVESLCNKPGRGFDSPLVSLEFFIHIILPSALWPWG